LTILNLSKGERNILYLCLVVILSSLIYITLVEPGVRGWRERRQKIFAQELRLEKNLKIIARRKGIESRYQGYSGRFKSQGTEEEEMAKMLKEIETLAGNLVHITDIKPRPAKEKEFYRQYSVEIEFEAPIKPLTQFIYGLQNSPQMFKITQLQLNAKGSDHLNGHMLATKVSIP